MKLAKWLPPSLLDGPGSCSLPSQVLILRVAVDRQIALGAVEHVADGVGVFLSARSPFADAGFVIRHPVADFELHHLLLAVVVEFEGAVQGVGRLLIVVEHEVCRRWR